MRCPVIPHSGWSWLADLGDGVNCLFVFNFIFLKIYGDYWQGAGMAKSVSSYQVGITGPGATYAVTLKKVSPDATHKLLRLMMLTIAGSPLGMEYC